MMDFELETLRAHPEWRQVLAAYHAEGERLSVLNPEWDGWLMRQGSFEGVEPENVPRIHGKLIALGFLKFQLAGSDRGMQYQLSHSARRVLSPSAEANDEDAGEQADAA